MDISDQFVADKSAKDFIHHPGGMEDLAYIGTATKPDNRIRLPILKGPHLAYIGTVEDARRTQEQVAKDVASIRIFLREEELKNKNQPEK